MKNIKLFIIVVTILAILYIPWKMNYNDKIKNWDFVSAEVSGYEVIKKRRGIRPKTSHFCLYSVEFTHKNIKVSDSTIDIYTSSQRCEYKIGDSIEILVDPNDFTNIQRKY